MISTIFHAVFYNPIYNILVALVALIPGGDMGVAVIVLTIFIRLILLPFSISNAKSQLLMKKLEPKRKEIEEQYKDDPAQKNIKTFELMRAEGVNPFSNILLVFAQLPVLLALYWVFRYESLTVLDMARLYAFTPLPHSVSLTFLGLFNMTSKSIVLAIGAGITQYLQARLMIQGMPPPGGSGMQADFSRAMNLQLRFVFPILIGTAAYFSSAAIALYFLTGNLFGTLQQWYINKTFKTD